MLKFTNLYMVGVECAQVGVLVWRLQITLYYHKVQSILNVRYRKAMLHDTHHDFVTLAVL